MVPACFSLPGGDNSDSLSSSNGLLSRIFFLTKELQPSCLGITMNSKRQEISHSSGNPTHSSLLKICSTTTLFLASQNAHCIQQLCLYPTFTISTLCGSYG